MRNQFVDICDVAVLGLGFAGAFTTEALCRRGFKNIVAIDANSHALGPQSSSRNECFKLHTGVHYLGDLETAKKCLKNSVVMASSFGRYIMDIDNPQAPTRRGRHYIMSNSQFSLAHVKFICESLQAYYAELLNDYPRARAVFGEPAAFIKYLDPADYSYVADAIPFTNEHGVQEMTYVVLGIETPECQIDIHQFSTYFDSCFAACDRLTVLYKHTVTRVMRAEPGEGYIIEVSSINPATGAQLTRYIQARCVVNCTWQNVEVLDKQLGFYRTDNRVNRVKVLARVELPAELEHMNTCIFSVGPHASITRYVNESGEPECILTYEPVTNVGHFPAGTLLSDIQDARVKALLSTPLTLESELGQYYSRALVEGVAKYIPVFKGARVKSIGLGFVKNFFSLDPSKGNAYLYGADSPHHLRQESGVEEKALGYISFSGMKMTYTFKIAQGIALMVREHLSIYARKNSIGLRYSTYTQGFGRYQAPSVDRSR